MWNTRNTKEQGNVLWGVLRFHTIWRKNTGTCFHIKRVGMANFSGFRATWEIVTNSVHTPFLHRALQIYLSPRSTAVNSTILPFLRFPVHRWQHIFKFAQRLSSHANTNMLAAKWRWMSIVQNINFWLIRSLSEGVGDWVGIITAKTFRIVWGDRTKMPYPGFQRFLALGELGPKSRAAGAWGSASPPGPRRPWFWPQLSESEKPLEPRVKMPHHCHSSCVRSQGCSNCNNAAFLLDSRVSWLSNQSIPRTFAVLSRTQLTVRFGNDNLNSPFYGWVLCGQAFAKAKLELTFLYLCFHV